MKTCVSCGKASDDVVSFPCPNCDNKINRCKHCRVTANKYACRTCSFEGP